MNGGTDIPAEECHDRIRFRLSDDSGILRFKDFEIVDAPQCRDVERKLREYLVDRPLAGVDVDYLRTLGCQPNGGCVRAVIDEVWKYQRLFVRNREDRSTVC